MARDTFPSLTWRAVIPPAFAPFSLLPPGMAFAVCWAPPPVTGGRGSNLGDSDSEGRSAVGRRYVGRHRDGPRVPALERGYSSRGLRTGRLRKCPLVRAGQYLAASRESCTDLGGTGPACILPPMPEELLCFAYGMSTWCVAGDSLPSNTVFERSWSSVLQYVCVTECQERPQL